MNRNILSVLGLLLALAAPLKAQDIGRVSPASLPVPLPTTAPVPPTVLRSTNPFYMSITGTWKFALTHGHVAAGGQYVSEDVGGGIVQASSVEEGHGALNAFDGDATTRWCASGANFPEWVSADLGKPEPITGVDITWEQNVDFQFRVEGSSNNKIWTVMADETALPGEADGPVTVTPGTFRYVRIFVTGAPAGQWASISEVQVHYTANGQDTIWQAPSLPPPTEAQLDSFAQPTFDDTGWDNIPVPSNWEMLGYSLPTYASVDNTVGQYRRYVTVPASWADKKIYWRFDGALDGAELFVNGQKAGYHESGYTAFDSDITDLIKFGKPNLFAIRVSKTTPSDDCETGDFQCMGGIFRETALIAVPPTHVSDITVRTPLTDNYRDAILNTNITVSTVAGRAVHIAGRLYTAKGVALPVTATGAGVAGENGNAVVTLSTPVTAPSLWSAEKPNLYYFVMQVSANGKPIERVEQRFGFRQVEVKNNVVLWNGVPIKCTGVCRHDFFADKGFALDEADWQKDITLMKEANINAIRTSHYNHAERFLEICEERGMYILDEVPFCWIGNSVSDPAYTPFLMQRAAETLARDKDRPCVLAWSIGNENPYGPDEQTVFNYVKQVDPTRPAFVSCLTPDQIQGQDWEDGHYPGPDNVDSDVKNAAYRTYDFSEHPHVFYQSETQHYDPGASDLWSEALIKTWQKIWNSTNILGSFIWEWQNQGIADKNVDQTSGFGYGPGTLRQENNKGIVDAFRNPKQEWWIVKQVYSKVVVGTTKVTPSGGTVIVPITNHYSFTNLNELTCHWTAFDGSAVLQSGISKIDCEPLQSTQATFPSPAGMSTLRLDFHNSDNYSVVAANLAVVGAPTPAPPVALAAGEPLTSQSDASTITISNDIQSVVFNKNDGTIASWTVRGKSILTGGPILNLGEAKASNEKGAYEAPAPPTTVAASITASAPDANGDITVTEVDNVLGAPTAVRLGTVTEDFVIKPDAEINVDWTFNWSRSDISLWEDGLKFQLPSTAANMNWLKDSFFTDYPPLHVGAPMGPCVATDTTFRASKRNLHWLTLTDSTNTGVVLLPTSYPLVGRANDNGTTTTLFASSQVSGPWDFSGSWVADSYIRAIKNQPLTGGFTLRAITQ